MPETPGTCPTQLSQESAPEAAGTAQRCGIASDSLRTVGMAWEASALPTALRPRAEDLRRLARISISGCRRLNANSAVSKSGADARFQVTGQRLIDLLGWEVQFEWPLA